MMFRNLTHVEFADKWVLLFIPAALVLAGLWWYFLAKKNYSFLKFSSTASFKSGFVQSIERPS